MKDEVSNFSTPTGLRRSDSGATKSFAKDSEREERGCSCIEATLRTLGAEATKSLLLCKTREKKMADTKSLSVEDYVESGRLIQVSVKIPPPGIFEVGDAWGEKTYGGSMCAFTCEANSRWIVEGMNARGELDWHIVGGFAFPVFPKWALGPEDDPSDNRPRIHVWVRRGDVHFDPTWSRSVGKILDISQNRYFALANNIPLEDNGLEHLKRLADGWNLETFYPNFGQD